MYKKMKEKKNIIQQQMTATTTELQTPVQNKKEL